MQLGNTLITKTLKNMKSYPFQKSILMILVVFAVHFASAQVSEPSKGFELIINKKNQPNNSFRINSVKANVDALITIEKLSGSATLDSIYLSGIGFSAAFQPEVSIAPGRWGYIQFDIQFVQAGTVIPVAVKDIPLAGKKYGRIKYAGSKSFDNNAELAVIRSSATSFKVRMYATNLSKSISSVRSNVFFAQYAFNNSSLIENSVEEFKEVQNTAKSTTVKTR